MKYSEARHRSREKLERDLSLLYVQFPGESMPVRVTETNTGSAMRQRQGEELKVSASVMASPGRQKQCRSARFRIG